MTRIARTEGGPDRAVEADARMPRELQSGSDSPTRCGRGMMVGKKRSGRGVRIEPRRAIGQEFLVVVKHLLPK